MVRREAIATSPKPNVIVIDIKDVSRRIQATAATLAGLPRAFDAMGGDIFELGDQMAGIDPRLAGACLDAKQLREIVAKIAQGLSVSEIDVFAGSLLDPVVEANSRFVWASVAPDTYALRVDDVTYTVAVDTLGSWKLSRDNKVTHGWALLLRDIPDVANAFKTADAYVAQQHPDKIGLIDAKAEWRRDAPTDKQIEWLVKKGVFLSEAAIPPSLTKGQASQMLDKAFARRKSA